MTKQYSVRMECVVRKRVLCEGCTEQQAKENPWDYAEEEYEYEQVDWKVLGVEEVE